MDDSTPRGIGFTCQWRWKVLILYYSKLERLVERNGLHSLSDTIVIIVSDLEIKKKKEKESTEIWLWRDDASFCGGMFGTAGWPETSNWRRDVAVADSSFSIFQMFSTISSINSDSRLQMQAKPQLE